MRRASLVVFFLLASRAGATEVSRSRVIESERPILCIIVRLGLGAVCSDVTLRGVDVSHVRLFVDGERRGHPLGRSLKAVQRIWWYITEDERAKDTSTSWRYSLIYEGYLLQRSSYIEDDRVVLTTWLYGPLGPRGRLKYACLIAEARQHSHGTTIRLTLTVRANSGICPHRSQSRLGLVNRLVASEIARQVDAGLWRLERSAREISSDPGNLTTAIERLLRR